MKRMKVNFQVTLPVTFLREGDSFIAYTPALDLSTVGDTLEEAKERFDEAVKIFFEEIVKKGTIDQALTELGWQKKNNQFFPPIVVSSQTEQFSIPRYN